MTDRLAPVDVSVITACYQHGRWLAEAGASVFAAATRRAVEWIVVNDGSTDDTAAVTAGFAARHPGAVRGLDAARVGQARARAAGAAVARGAFWVLLDADDRLEPGMLERCADALERTPDAAAAAGDVWLTAADGRRRLLRLRQGALPPWPDVLEQNPIGGLAGVMLRADAVRRVGGLAVDGAPGVEDWDLWARFARAGLTVTRVAGVLGCYRQAPGSYSRRAADMLRARLELFERCRRPDPRLAAFPAAAAGLDDARFRRLCGGAVFFALGTAAATPADGRVYDALLASLDAGAVDVPAAVDAFRRGLWHAAVLSAGPRRVDLAPVFGALESRLKPALETSALAALRDGLEQTARGLGRMRLAQRIKTLGWSLRTFAHVAARHAAPSGGTAAERNTKGAKAQRRRDGDGQPISSVLNLSVILCTHNPRPAYLTRVMEGLRRQSLTPDHWELLIVDNASEPRVEGAVDIAWHPRGRVIREEELGLTPARLRGIREASGDVLVFVDDDSVLADEYLAEARHLFSADDGPRTTHPRHPLGVAGGVIRAEFAIPPPAWAGPYLGYLAVRDMGPADRRLLPGGDWRRLPWGVGMCVRREVADAYARRVNTDRARRGLDRCGKALTGSGDLDLALTAHDLGACALYTPRLQLTHLIPRERLTEDYFRRLLEGSAYSTAVLQRLRGVRRQPAWLRRILRRLRRLPRVRPATLRVMRTMEAAIDRGERRAREETG